MKIRRSIKTAIGWAAVGAVGFLAISCVCGCSAASPSVSQTAGDGSTQLTETAVAKVEVSPTASLAGGDGAVLHNENAALKAELDLTLAKLEARDVEVVAMKGKLEIATEVGGNMNSGWVVVALGCIPPVSLMIYTLANRNRRFRKLKHGTFCTDADKPP